MILSEKMKIFLNGFGDVVGIWERNRRFLSQKIEVPLLIWEGEKGDRIVIRVQHILKGFL
jgi:hypothetical protein